MAVSGLSRSDTLRHSHHAGHNSVFSASGSAARSAAGRIFGQLDVFHVIAIDQQEVGAEAAAGVPVEQLPARGHFHSSSTMADVIATAASGGEKMALALQPARHF